MWFSDGFKIFKKKIFLLILMGITYSAISFLTLLIPLIGPLISVFVFNILIIGLFKVLHEFELGKDVKFWHLFSGFKEDKKRLLGLYCVGLAIIIFCTILFCAILFSQKDLLFEALQKVTSIKWDSPNSMSSISIPKVLYRTSFILSLYLSIIPLATILVIYAPFLIIFKNQKIIESIINSARGVMNHKWLIIKSLFIFVCILILSAKSYGLVWIVASPFWFCSFYYSYKEIFEPAFKSRLEI